MTGISSTWVKPLLLEVGHQVVGDLVVAPVALVGVALPRAEVHLVDAIGSWAGFLGSRADIHASSPHVWEDSWTCEDVSGGVSVANAIGSARSVQTSSAPSTSYLYFVPEPTPGTNSSQTPEDAIARIGCSRPSQELKSPFTRTPLACGAHTAKETPLIWPKGPS